MSHGAAIEAQANPCRACRRLVINGHELISGVCGTGCGGVSRFAMFCLFSLVSSTLFSMGSHCPTVTCSSCIKVFASYCFLANVAL